MSEQASVCMYVCMYVWQVKKSIQERYKVMSGTPVGYSAQQGDVVVADMYAPRPLHSTLR